MLRKAVFQNDLVGATAIQAQRTANKPHINKCNATLGSSFTAVGGHTALQGRHHFAARSERAQAGSGNGAAQEEPCTATCWRPRSTGSAKAGCGAVGEGQQLKKQIQGKKVSPAEGLAASQRAGKKKERKQELRFINFALQEKKFVFRWTLSPEEIREEARS